MEQNKKIVVRLDGGLGNQFFQYALGYAICQEHGQELLLDKSAYETYKRRVVELDNFNLTVKYAPEELINQLNKKRIFGKTLYKDKRFSFTPSLLKIKNSAYLKGFWQTEKYFKKYEKDVKNLFKFKDYSFIQNHDLLSEIQSTNSVSINLRLCEYVSNLEIAKIHYICKENYYKNALNYINDKLENPKYYVFSDDIEMAKGYLPSGYEYVFCNTANWKEDLYFMQNAKHNIIANSSFSWMAAWLNKNEEKIVVAPTQWFTKVAKINYKDVVPKSWVKVEV
ncbi:MAG: alpha-1,2-fucosyltransferase [bacterium]|nr:alpha-1,2-fucosyltransferase [bacterium]